MALSKNPKEKSEAFVALLIDEKSIQTGIWRIEDGKTNVLSVGEQQSWEGKKADDLAESIDVSLSAAVSKLADLDVKEPQKVIFGLPSAWTKEGRITEEKLELLRQLSKKLSLKPVGFVVITEALSHFLKAKEGTPVSAILIGLDVEKIEIALVHLGKILGIESVARSDNLALDAEEGLLRFPKDETFPPRMILYGEGDFESEKQTLVSYPWQEPERKLPFLHFPRVEVALENFAINALCLAGGSEIAKSSQLVEEGETGQRESAKEARTQKEIADERLVITGAPKKAEPPETVDLGKEDKDMEKEEQPEELEQSEHPEKDLGFVMGKDVLVEGVKVSKVIKDIEKEEKDKVKKVEQVEQVEEEQPVPVKKVEGVEKVVKVERTKSLFLSTLVKIRSLAGIIPRLKIPKFRLPGLASSPPKFALLGLFLIVFGGLFWAYKTVPKAQITIFVLPQDLKEEFELTLDPNAIAWDEKKKILPAQTIVLTLSQSKTMAATGKKTVGEKAKGEVAIFNRTDDKKTFAAGAVLVGPGGLEFTLDAQVAVASKTPDLVGGVDKWGEAKVGVTAAGIGAEFNLAADSQFAFEKFASSLFLGKNTSAFSGGTSRQVLVVSEENRSLLSEKLEEELVASAKEEVLAQIAEDRHFVEESLQVDIVRQEYDRKAGEEAQEVNLTLDVEATGLTFVENTAKDFLYVLLKDKVGDQDFRWEEAKLDFEVVEVNKDGSVQFKARLEGKLYPDLSEEEIALSLAGKSLDFQKNYLDGLPRASGFETKITPGFFTRFGRLPSLPQNIKVEIEAK